MNEITELGRVRSCFLRNAEAFRKKKRIQSTGKKAATREDGGTFLFEIGRKYDRRTNREDLMGVRARFPWGLLLTRSLFFMSSHLGLFFLFLVEL